MTSKMIPIKPGDTRVIGEREYELTPDGGLTVQMAAPVRDTYNIGGLLARKAQIETELVEIDLLLAEHAELIKQQTP